MPCLDLLNQKESCSLVWVYLIYVSQKPMNAYLDISVYSFHSRNTYRSFIESEVRRYTMWCTNSNDVSDILVKLRERLKARGYADTLLDVCLSRVFVRNDI